MIRVCPIFACPIIVQDGHEVPHPEVVKLLSSCDYIYTKNTRAYERAKSLLPNVKVLLMPECNRLKPEEVATLHEKPLEEMKIIDVSDIMDAIKP